MKPLQRPTAVGRTVRLPLEAYFFMSVKTVKMGEKNNKKKINK